MQVDKDVLQAALARAITDSVTPEVQREVFALAISNFLFNVNNRGESVITDAFQQALRTATSELATKVVASNAEAIRGMLQQAFNKWIAEPETLAKLTKGFTSGFPRY